MLLDQLLQGGTGGAEQAPGGGTTAAPALVGDAATGHDASGFSLALGLLTAEGEETPGALELLTAGGEETPDGTSPLAGESTGPDLTFLLAASEGVETSATSGAVLEAAPAAAGTVVPAAGPEAGPEVPGEPGDELAGTRPSGGVVSSASTVVATGEALVAHVSEPGEVPLAPGARIPSPAMPSSGPSGPIATEGQPAPPTVPTAPSADAGSLASSRPAVADGPLGQADAVPTRTAASPTGGAPAPVAEQQTTAGASPGGAGAAPLRAATPPPAESDQLRPAPVAPEGAPAPRVASEQAATLVAAASRPGARQATGSNTPVVADADPPLAGSAPPTTTRPEVSVTQSDGTGLVAGIGEEASTTGTPRTVAHAAIVAAGETLARATGQRPPAPGAVSTTTIASAGNGETGSTPLTQGAPAASQTSPTGVLARVDQPQGFSALAERIVDALHLSAVRGGSEIRLRVEPHGLGHIDVRVQLQDDGVRAMIVAEHEATRALISSNQHLLEAALGRSELRLSGFSVDLGLDQGGMDFDEAEQGGEQEATSGSSEHDAREREAASGQDLQQASVVNGRLSLRV